eukprot:3210634-Alexandrium_andersonii.AAC.1
MLFTSQTGHGVATRSRSPPGLGIAVGVSNGSPIPGLGKRYIRSSGEAETTALLNSAFALARGLVEVLFDTVVLTS